MDLRPGTYAMTFTLTGFATVRRDGIILEANFTAPINAEMKVGAVQESVTVTGESPIVDVQTSSRREVVTQQLLESIPTGRNFQLMAGTVHPLPAILKAFRTGVGVPFGDYGADLREGQGPRTRRGIRDAISAASRRARRQRSPDGEPQVTGGTAENQLSGVLVNRIPRTGGNSFSGDGVFLLANGSTQGVNLDNALRARGITTPDQLFRDYDVNYSLGGPLKKDRLWFFVSGRNWAYNNYVANAFNPDGTQAVDDNTLKAFPGRLTAQIDPRDRVTAMFDWSSKIRGHRTLASNVAPEAAFRQSSPAQHILQAKGMSTLTSKLLPRSRRHRRSTRKKARAGDRHRHLPFDLATACAPGSF